MQVRVRHYSYSRTGGAGRCAEAISSAQARMGVDSDFVYRTNKGLRSLQAVTSYPSTVLAATVDELLVKAPGTPSLFSLYRSKGPAMGNPRNLALETNDVSHLHWIEGMIPRSVIRDVLSSGAKMVWTLHDMAPFTGGCHFSLDCEGFVKDCQGCPQVRPTFQKSVQDNLWDKRSSLAGAGSSNLRLIAPSSWLQGLSLKSKVLAGFEVDVIPNPISLEFFKGQRIRQEGETPTNHKEFVITVVAEDLANPVKRIDLLIGLLHKVSVPTGTSLVVKLAGHNGSSFQSDRIKVLATGVLSPKGLIELFDETDLLVSVSVAESAGMTIKEAGSRGVPSLILGAPGAKATIIPEVTGLIAETETQFVQLLESLMNDRSKLMGLGSAAKRDVALNNHPDIVAERYLQIYQELFGQA
jgi:glycosyltransferase involved in cell wall biosynthesis